MNSQFSRQLAAEFIGTFALVLIGAGAVTASQGGNVVVAALAHGLILVGLISTYGHISGAHFNPAVTLGMLIGQQIEITRAVAYWVVQVLGGIAAGLVLRFVFPGVDNLGQTVPAAGVGSIQVLVIEAILTFFLVSVIYQAAVYNKVGNIAAIAIGFTLAGCILFGGPITGASLNPARTLGPGLVTGRLTDVIFYLIGTLGGGALGGIVHVFLFPNPTSK
jgi:MIP family channel proteins